MISKNYEHFYNKYYYKLKDIFEKYNIDGKAFFQNVYMKADGHAQYQMWKEGYVDSCPAERLLKDLFYRDLAVFRLVDEKYNVSLPYCKAYFYDIEAVIKGYLKQANKSLKIAMAWFTNKWLFEAVLEACRRGVEVQLIINNDQINNSPEGLHFNDLIKLGAKIYIPEQLIHQKYCIIDDTIVINGSYNWTTAAEMAGQYENIVVMEKGEVIKDFIRDFKWLVDHNYQIDSMPPPVNRDYQGGGF